MTPVIEYTYAQMDDDHAPEVHDFEFAVTEQNRGSLGELTRFLGNSGMGIVVFASHGYSRLQTLAAVCLYEGDTRTRIIHVTSLLVDHSYRRSKLATGLLYRVARQAHEAGWACRCDVEESNLPAQLLLKSCDWSATHVHREKGLYCFACLAPAQERLA